MLEGVDDTVIRVQGVDDSLPDIFREYMEECCRGVGVGRSIAMAEAETEGSEFLVGCRSNPLENAGSFQSWNCNARFSE